MSRSTFDPARCEIEPAKIIKYLLDLSSADGAGKARFFISRGFSLESWELLADALKKHAASNPASVAGSNPWGTKYEVEGLIDTPNGKTAFIGPSGRLRATTRRGWLRLILRTLNSEI
jgi:hypothetical protein